MRLCTFTQIGEDERRQRAGIIIDEEVFEVGDAKRTLMEILCSGDYLKNLRPVGEGKKLTEVRLLAPIPRPGKILATIVNTQAMLGGPDIHLDRPRIDMKAPSTVIGPMQSIYASPSGIRPEVELAAIIGKRIKHATAAEASRSIAGYTVLNDVTAPVDRKEDAYEAYRRDRATGLIRKIVMPGPLFRSKNHDTFCPVGPWMVTTDEIDISSKEMMAMFDELVVQKGSTSDYLFTPAEIASYVSGFLTLEPGDIITCGSIGYTKEVIGELDPSEYVLPKRNGTLRLKIEGIGELVNPVEFER